MENVKVALEGNELVVRMDLTQDLGLSKSGKTRLVASTKGNVPVPGREEFRLGINLYKYVH